MNFTDLLVKLEKIDKKQTLMESNLMEQLTLQQVQAAEKAAMDKAAEEKKTGMFGGIFKTDPRTAGDVALAKLAAQNKLPGLFNSKGEFVVADNKRMDRGPTGGAPTTPVQKAPPTPADYEPLAKLGLVPQNASGPAGLVNVLTGGDAKRSFDAAKTSSAKVGADQTSASFKADKLKQLNDLVAKLKAEIGDVPPPAGGTPLTQPTGIKEALLREFNLLERPQLPQLGPDGKPLPGEMEKLQQYMDNKARLSQQLSPSSAAGNTPPAAGTPLTPPRPDAPGSDLVSQITAIMKELGDMGDDPEVVAALNAAQKVLDAKKAKDTAKTAASGSAGNQADQVYQGANTGGSTTAQTGGSTTAQTGGSTTAQTGGSTTAQTGGEKGSKPLGPTATTQEKMDRFVWLMNKKKGGGTTNAPGTVGTATNVSPTVGAMASGQGTSDAVNLGTGPSTKESLINLISHLKKLEESVLFEQLSTEEEAELQKIAPEIIRTVNSGSEGIPKEVMQAVTDYQGSTSTGGASSADASGGDKPAPATTSGYKGSKGSQEIQKLNPEIKDVNKISVGQKIKLPGGGEYTVAKGDTLDAIAAGKYKGTPPSGTTTPAKPDGQTPAKPDGQAPTNTAQRPPEQIAQAPYVSTNKLANDWAYSVFIGKATVDKVPSQIKAEVEKVLANPPKHWKKPEASATTTSTTSTTPSTDVSGIDMVAARKTPEWIAIFKEQSKKTATATTAEKAADLEYKKGVANGTIKNAPMVKAGGVKEELNRILSIAGLK